MTVFHAALEQLVKGTSLQLKVKKEVYESGNVTFTASFKGKNDSEYSRDRLTALFKMYDNDARIHVNIEDTSFDSQSDNLLEKLELNDQVNAIVKTIMTSEEIKEKYLAVVREESIKVAKTYGEALDKLKNTHMQLTEESAKQLVEQMIERTREHHKEENKDNNDSRYNVAECESMLNAVQLHDNGTTRTDQFYVTIKKRVNFKMNHLKQNKEDLAFFLVGKWVNKNGKQFSTY